MLRSGPQEALEVARLSIRQGLLDEAARALATVGPEAPEAERASAQLLLGNIAYERGDYSRAAEAWRQAAALFPAGSEAVEVVAGNLEMAQARLARQAVLDRERTDLQVQLVALLVVAALALTWAAWHTRASRRPGPAT